eukprot:SM000011S18975  [mRNA]  locus=s11:154637:156615:- [translate_table: standard]
MAPGLAADVPLPYASWAEFDLLAPPRRPKDAALAPAAAFVSNCDAANWRLQALDALAAAGLAFDSYGRCRHNVGDADGSDKHGVLSRYKFSLAFENSCEEGYVTEKFYHSLEAGAVPVVLGAPDILDFAPSNNSVIVYRSLNDTRPVVEAITRLSKDEDAYWKMLEWKRTGPSDSFKAIADISAVHSTCRLCILLATCIQEREELQLSPKRPCRCRESWAKGILYHVRVRERMRFSFKDVFLYLEGLTLRSFCAKVVRTFGAYMYQPIWHNVRPNALKSQGPLKVFRVYPAYATQKAALFGNASFRTSSQLRQYLEITPCPRLEVIFV